MKNRVHGIEGDTVDDVELSIGLSAIFQQYIMRIGMFIHVASWVQIIVHGSLYETPCVND
jgi:hypothetical protein